MDIRSLSGPMELSDILDTPSPLIRVNACMYEYMPHMYIFVTALSNIPLIMLCMFPHGLYSLLDYEVNLSYLIYLNYFGCVKETSPQRHFFYEISFTHIKHNIFDREKTDNKRFEGLNTFMSTTL